jgi:hypothetical protein
LSLLLPVPESLDIRQVTVALAEMLEQLGIGQQREAHRIRFPGPRVGFRVVYRDVDLQVAEVGPVKRSVTFLSPPGQHRRPSEPRWRSRESKATRDEIEKVMRG